MKGIIYLEWGEYQEKRRMRKRQHGTGVRARLNGNLVQNVGRNGARVWKTEERARKALALSYPDHEISNEKLTRPCPADGSSDCRLVAVAESDR